MTAGGPTFPRTENGYSPEHVDRFVVALAERARSQIAGLERRVAELTTPQDASLLDERLASLQRLVAEREAQISEERARVMMLQKKIDELTAIADPVVEFDMAELSDESSPSAEPRDWAASVIERTTYDSWTDEQRIRAAEALRRKRLSACTPADR